jgi:hypothetical protein
VNSRKLTLNDYYTWVMCGIGSCNLALTALLSMTHGFQSIYLIAVAVPFASAFFLWRNRPVVVASVDEDADAEAYVAGVPGSSR